MLSRTLKQLTCSLKFRLNYFLFKTNYYTQQTLKAAHAHRTNYNMNKVYMRTEPGSNELHISFRYVNTDLKIDRDFNFCRKIDEKIEDSLNRIRGNIEKELNKRTKKSKKKLPAAPEVTPSVIPGGEVNLLDC